jgi:hypothetical protein
MGEFKFEFKQICMQDNHGIEAKSATSHNHHSTIKYNHLASAQNYILSMIFSVNLVNIVNFLHLGNKKNGRESGSCTQKEAKQRKI